VSATALIAARRRFIEVPWRLVFAEISAGSHSFGPSPGRPAGVELARQNMGNGPPFLLRWTAIRATLRSLRGFDQIQL